MLYHFQFVWKIVFLQEREEYEQAEEQRRKAYEAEMARLEREAEERNRQRQQEEHEMIKKKQVQERVKELRKTNMFKIDEEVMLNIITIILQNYSCNRRRVCMHLS